MISMDEMAAAARALVEAEQATIKAEEKLAEAKEKERNLREEVLPNMFSELGIDKLTLADGSKLSVKQDVYASIPVAQRQAAYAWLEKEGDGGLIKTTVSLEFSKGELEKAKQFVEWLQENKIYGAALDRNVHPQTLKAYLRERLENEKPFDLDMFGARPVMTAKVVMP